MRAKRTNLLFEVIISPILFHSILFFSIFLNLYTIPSILFYFFNFLNIHTISLNLNNLYRLKIYKIKPFYNYFKPFYKIIPNYFSTHFFIPKYDMKCNVWNDHPKQEVRMWYKKKIIKKMRHEKGRERETYLRGVTYKKSTVKILY